MNLEHLASLLPASIRPSPRFLGFLLVGGVNTAFHAQQTLDRLDADLRSGTLRLSIRTAERPPSPSSHSPAAGPEQTRADIDPADAAALVRITSAGDDAIIDLNTCIDAYGKVMLQANGTAQP